MKDRTELLEWLKNNNAFANNNYETLTSGIARKIKNRPEVMTDFQTVLNLDSDDPSELIYNVVHPECSGVCEVCGKPVEFVKYYFGYRKTCSKACAAQMTVDGGRETKLEKYGDSHYNNKEKNQQTKLEKYGNAFYLNHEQGRQTKLERYGSANYNNMEKNKQTCLERYGTTSANRLPEVKEKQRRTLFERYGVNTPMESEKVKQKYAENYLKKHGVPFPLQDREVRKKFNYQKETANESAIEEFLKNRGFNYQYRYVVNNKEFDFAVFDENDKLVLLIESDGEYFHGLLSDPDGKHVMGINDAERFYQTPEGVKLLVIDATTKKDDIFNEILRVFDLDYESWIKEIEDNLPSEFPYPEFDNKRMLNDWKHLREYYYNKGQKLATSIIKNYHKSIYSAHVGNNPSPLEAWSNKDLLNRCIRNRFIYSSNLSSKAIADGFNICKIAPKVSVFNPSLAKHLVDTYLNDYNTVFDPFSGFSGRMLGVCASDKTYIGQDIDEEHVRESNKIISFLNIPATVTTKNVLESEGEYDCLFTCSPYKDKESWGTDLINKSCDEWIDECLKRFKCKKYLFVVNETSKYQDNIVETIENKSHFSSSKEYVVLL